MSELFLLMYGARARVWTEERSLFTVIESLRLDFAPFVETAAPAPGQACAVSVCLGGGGAIQPPLGLRKFFRNRMCTVYGWRSRRLADYGDQAWVFSSGKNPRLFAVHAPSPAVCHELAYLALLSACGEALDDRGYHRVHALGIQAAEEAGLLVLPSGGGKSALAALLLQNNPARVRLYSDETPLLRGRHVFPFALRLALRPEVAQALQLPREAARFARKLYPAKALYPIPAVAIAAPRPVTFVLVGKAASTQEPSIRPCTRLRAVFSLFEAMVVGVGVAQIAEHFLRIDRFFALVAIALSRGACALRTALGSRAYVFSLSSDARQNLTVLDRFLQELGESR